MVHLPANVAGRATVPLLSGGVLATVTVRTLERTLPYLPVVMLPALSEVAGLIAYLASPGARRAVRANQRIVAPARRPRVRQTFVAQARHYLDTFQLFRASPERIRAWVEVEHWERFLAAHAAGSGVVMASAHFGPVNVCGQIFRARGFDTTMPVEDEGSEFARAINRARAALGGRFIATSSARGIYRVLRQGGVLGVIADRAVTGTGERVQFFGREVLLPSAHISLALRANAAVIPAFAYRTAGGVCLRFEEPLDLRRTGDHDADVRDGMRQFVRIMERHLAALPEAWTIFEPVWDR